MSLFKPAESTSAFLKMGLLGFAGSGKTKTATLTAIGLVEYMKERGIDYADRPVFGLDTETGFDWVKPDFDGAGIPLYVAKTRAFADLLIAVREAQAGGSVLIVDSISHFWKELCDSYVARKKAQLKTTSYRLQFQDWGFLKGEWGKFTDAFINSSLHIILCGRAGYEYDYFENDEGKRELEKTGVKMKAEGEMGYEPSLLVLMERHQKVEGSSVVDTWRTATVLKDRSTLLDGKDFTNPNFKTFLPHIERLNLGGKHMGVDTSRTSEHVIPADRKDWTSTQKAIVLEEIEAILVEHYPSTKAEDKAAKAALVLQHFDTRSWTEVTNMRVDELRRRYDALHRALKDGQPSRYAAPAVEDGGEPVDRLPDHSAAEASTAPAEPAEPKASLEEQLLADLAKCETVADCFHWGKQVSARADLDTAMRMRLSDALTKRQNDIGKAEAAAKAAAAEGEEKPEGRKQRKPKAEKAAAEEPASTPAPVQASPAYGYGQPYVFI